MRLLTHFPMFCFILVLLSIVGLCVAQGHLQLLLVAGALAAISWYVTEGPRGRSLPRWVSNVLVVGITLHVLVDLLQSGGDILESLSRFALWLTLIKLYERRTPRDHAQLISLSFLLMLIAALQTTELLFGLILALYAALGLYVLVLYQLYAAHDQMRQDRRSSVPEGVHVVPSTKPIIGRAPAMQFRTLIFMLGVAGFLLSIITFMTFPRGLGDAAFGDIHRSLARSVTGFIDEVDLLHGGRINESRREVMRVQILDEHGDRHRLAEPLLLKGAVLDTYEGNGLWSRSDRPRIVHHTSEQEFRPFAPRREGDGREMTMRVELLTDSRTIFTTRRVISLRIDSVQKLKYDPMAGVIEVDVHGPPIDSYEIRFDLGPMISVARRNEPATQRAWRNSLRHLSNPNVRELAREILENEGLPVTPPSPPPLDSPSVDIDDGEVTEAHDAITRWEWARDAAQAFERFLRSPRFEYSLDLSHVVHVSRNGGYDDPIVRFLLHHRRGHCEYFASAMMALLYNAGIESRLVTGYVAAAYDEAQQHYKVMELNAHAWVEVRTGQQEWRSYDPTPRQVIREFHAPETTRADQLRWFYERFDLAWNRTVVRYDSQSQTRLAQRWELGLGDRADYAAQRIKLWLDDLQRMFMVGPAAYLWLGLIGVIVVLATIVFIQLLRRLMTLRSVLRLQHVHGREHARLLHQLGFYLDMLTVLERANITKPPWQPPVQFAQQLAETNPEEAAIVHRIADAFYRARYGHQPLSPEEVRELRAGVRALADRFGVRRGH